MTIAIYGRPVNENQLALAKNVLEFLSDAKIEYIVHKPYLQFLQMHCNLKETTKTFNDHEDLKGKVDFLFSVGGDGTLLDTIMLIKDSMIPVVGVNTGRLGFLSGISENTLRLAIESLAKGHYSLDPRTMLRLETNSALFEHNIALNEFTIHKKETSSMVTIHAYLNGEYLNSYWADGIMISTPTGSTGYSLSCGGPIIMPQSESFVITPIAPHNLNVRPMVVSDKNIISLEVEGRSQNFMATLDSRSATIDSSVQLAVKKEAYPINLIRFANENFLNTLRKKLNWGLDSRN